METLMNVVAVVVALYVVSELAAALYIYRNRRTMVPRLQSAVRRFLGLDVDFNHNATAVSELAQLTDTLNRKVTILGRWAKQERQVMIKRGIVTPIRSNNLEQ